MKVKQIIQTLSSSMVSKEMEVFYRNGLFSLVSSYIYSFFVLKCLDEKLENLQNELKNANDLLEAARLRGLL